jgi:hypothetical protein
LTVLRYHSGVDGVAPEVYGEDLRVEFARALSHGWATITPAGRLHITEVGCKEHDGERLESYG